MTKLKNVDETRCVKMVHYADGFYTHQCTRKRGYRPDGEYCKQHDPAQVKAREEKREKAFQEEWKRKKMSWAKDKVNRQGFDICKMLVDANSIDDLKAIKRKAHELMDEYEQTIEKIKKES